MSSHLFSVWIPWNLIFHVSQGTALKSILTVWLFLPSPVCGKFLLLSSFCPDVSRPSRIHILVSLRVGLSDGLKKNCDMFFFL